MATWIILAILFAGVIGEGIFCFHILSQINTIINALGTMRFKEKHNFFQVFKEFVKKDNEELLKKAESYQASQKSDAGADEDAENRK